MKSARSSNTKCPFFASRVAPSGSVASGNVLALFTRDSGGVVGSYARDARADAFSTEASRASWPCATGAVRAREEVRRRRHAFKPLARKLLRVDIARSSNALFPASRVKVTPTPRPRANHLRWGEIRGEIRSILEHQVSLLRVSRRAVRERRLWQRSRALHARFRRRRRFVRARHACGCVLDRGIARVVAVRDGRGARARRGSSGRR